MAPHQSSSRPLKRTLCLVQFLDKLPRELSGGIFSQIPNYDLKNLRLTCKRVSDIVCPYIRFQRVFISANPRNIEVFRSVANHGTFRYTVREIIWDDARFLRSPEEGSGYHMSSQSAEDYEFEDPPLPEGVPFWFAKACRENIQQLDYRRGRDVETLQQHVEIAEQLASQLPAEMSYAYYQELLRQEEDILTAAADTAAFEWAIENDRFPNLQRLTITPAAHGILFEPLYPTPMIRSLPYGFNYPLPRGWPTPAEGHRVGSWPWEHENIKEKWHCFRIVTCVLARQDHTKVPELIIDGNQINTGIPCGIFQAPEPCEEYDNLVTLVQKPGFTTLRLNLTVGSQEWSNYPAFRNGRIKRALTADLQHFTLETDEDENLDYAGPQPLANPPDHFIPLRSIFPVEVWTHLVHFGLSRFLVKEQDLLNLLGALPDTLRSVELSFLWFMKNSGNYSTLLNGIRGELGWRERSAKPRITIRDRSDARMSGRAVLVDNEVHEFLYGSGENPYPDDPRPGVYVLRVGKGFGREVDAFEPRYDRPWTTPTELMRLGIRKGYDVD